MRFSSVLELGGKTATGFEVPAEVVAALGAGNRPAVTVTIGDYSYRSSVARMGGRFLVPVSAEHRRAIGAAAGDALTVDLVLDTEPRTVDVPAALAEALAAAPAARAFFDGLSYSRKRGIVEPISAAKTEETRRRRIERSIAALGEGVVP